MDGYGYTETFVSTDVENVKVYLMFDQNYVKASKNHL